MRILVARIHSWRDEWPSDVGMAFATSKTCCSQCHMSHPNERSSPLPRGACSATSACFVFPSLACHIPTSTCCSCWMTDSTDCSNFCGSRTCWAWRSGTLSFVRQKATRAWDLLSRDTAFWKPGSCLTMRIRESKLRKCMLWPQGLFFVGTRRGDSNPGYLYASIMLFLGQLCHWLTACPWLSCATPYALFSLPILVCPLAGTVLAHMDLTSSEASIHPCLFLSCCGADNSYIPSIALWFLSSFGRPCAKYCWSACWPAASGVSKASQRLWSICSSAMAACLLLQHAGWAGAGQSLSLYSHPAPCLYPMPSEANWPWCEDQPLNWGLSVHSWHSKDSLKWEGVCRALFADFWFVLNAVWQIRE